VALPQIDINGNGAPLGATCTPVPNYSKSGLESNPTPTFRRHTKSKSQIAALQSWFQDNPNPTPAQLSEYAQSTGLEKSQVRDWFAN
jgi:hypothetical protein